MAEETLVEAEMSEREHLEKLLDECGDGGRSYSSDPCGELRGEIDRLQARLADLESALISIKDMTESAQSYRETMNVPSGEPVLAENVVGDVNIVACRALEERWVTRGGRRLCRNYGRWWDTT